MQTKSQKAVTEWVGGTVKLPVFVTGESEGPYRPEAVLWMLPDGPVLGMAMLKPDASMVTVIEHFHETTKQPMLGRPHMPMRVRVASPELATELRRALGSQADVVCAPTPEIDRFALGLHEQLRAENPPEKDTYFSEGLTKEMIASFFRSSARLFRVAPWKIVPDDSAVLSITIASLNVHRAALSIVGALGESLGFLLFPDHDAFELFLDAANVDDDHAAASMLPSFLALNFERGAEIAPDLRKEVRSNGWEVAGAKAYPSLVAIDEKLVHRPPTPRELAIADAICFAVAELIEKDRKQLKNAWKQDKGFVTTTSVDTHAGPIEITLAAPYFADRPIARLADGTFDIAAEVRDQDGELDELWFESFSNEVIRYFVMSPEAQALAADVGWCQPLMDFAKNYHSETVATMNAAVFREILFEIFPRKMSCNATEAASIVNEFRAFWTFLKREFAIPNAGACLQILDDGSIARLERALSDPANFGIAKSFFMRGEGAKRPQISEADSRAKKNKRKAQRADRKKNR